MTQLATDDLLHVDLTICERNVKFDLAIDPGFISDVCTVQFMKRDGCCEPEVAHLMRRVIRPGDPILRVKTDESIASVIAMFPFGLVQPLRYLSSEDIWQTRFLAPTDMQDGTYTVRLILRDRVGHTYRESKTFVIASKAPVVQVKLDRKRYQRGQAIELKVSASESTRTLVARMDGAVPVALRWDAKAAANTGTLMVPEQAIPGSYKLTITAEDIAHNIGTQEVQIEVLP